MKKCSVCKELKSLEEFGNYTASKDGKHYRCKPCDKKAVSGYRRGPRKLEYREKIRHNQRKYKYGIEPEEYENMLQKQEKSCAICKEPLVTELTRKDYKRKAVIDHCHKTNKVRGILCTRCNQGLGLFRDDQKILKSAIDYLKE